MGTSPITLRSILGFLFVFVQLASALKFDLTATSGGGKNERCIRNFVSKDQLVVVTATVGGTKGDGQKVNIHIKDAMGNDYGRPKDVIGETRQLFTSPADTAFDVCFENQLTGHNGISNPTRPIELDVDIGADARDWNSIQHQEKLKPVETDLRRIEEMVTDIVTEMEYLREREQRLRDTNESTNERVKWFAFGTMGMLVGLGAWQVVYLRAYFRYVHVEVGWEVKIDSVTDFVADLSTLFRFSASGLLAYFVGSFWFGSCIANLFACRVAFCSNSHDLNDIKCKPCFLQPGHNNTFFCMHVYFPAL
ncbi:unnamed protein product [Penicillium salamii]|uniref:GOLD domain-containing protein n=1 Tax=Penicillium salamii TaxID=1612424 RepID=A0A9W4IWA1_9EURO|nr:unnamed protein product [Penicillium salamii]